jgi:mono/diheme cytochrome c family protein
MKTTITILIFTLIVVACHRKTVAPSDNIILSNKTTTETKVSASNPETASAGQTIYTNRCGRCHGLKKTENYTPQQWETILKNMMPKARLTDDEAKQVTVYVMSHAKK